MHSNKLIYFFKIISFLEGVSYILLLFIAMPLKYVGNNEMLVKILGWPHGILFVIYILYLYIEYTLQGGTILRLKTSKEFGNLNKSFPPNEDIINSIKNLIKNK